MRTRQEERESVLHEMWRAKSGQGRFCFECGTPLEATTAPRASVPPDAFPSAAGPAPARGHSPSFLKSGAAWAIRSAVIFVFSRSLALWVAYAGYAGYQPNSPECR